MITKDIMPDNMALTTFHRVKEIHSYPPFSMATIEVVSYPNEQAFLAGANHTWVHRLQMSLAAVTGSLLDHTEAWLVESQDSPFFGGFIVVDQTETLENAKERAWTRLKRIREIKLALPFECAGHVYDSNIINISASAFAAFVAVTQGLEYSKSFTLANNDVVVLDGPQMIAVGQALDVHVDTVYNIARGLREQLFAIIETEEVTKEDAIAQVNAIMWPI